MTYQARVVADGLRLRSSPSLAGGIIYQFSAGDVVNVLDTPEVVTGQIVWANVQSNGTTGWCARLQGTSAYLQQVAAPSVVGQLTVVAADLRLRRAPSTSALTLHYFNAGDQVDLYDTPSVVTGNIVWAHVRFQGTDGWAAKSEGGAVYLQPQVANLSRAQQLAGLHMLQGGVGRDNLISLARQLWQAGAAIPSATVINDVGLANSLAGNGYVKYVLFRIAPDGTPNIPYSAAAARQAGADWFNARWGTYSQLLPCVYPAPVNEGNEADNSPFANEFWMGVCDALEAKNRKGALLGFSDGHPDDEGRSAEAKWQALQPVLERAKQKGHVICLDCYSAPGTSPGSLSSDAKDYELRPFQRLYPCVPQSAWPALIIKEAAREYSHGSYDGPDNTIKWMAAYGEACAQAEYLEAINYWTAGALGWPESSIDGALPNFIAWKLGKA